VHETPKEGGKEDHEKDTTTVHHDGSGATFGRRDSLGGYRRSDGAGVDPAANITATFSEAISTKSLGICNRCTSTTSSKSFYLLQGNFTAPNPTKNPPRFCTNTATGTTAPCPTPIPATVSYNAGTFNTAVLDPSSSLLPNTTYTAVVEGTADGDFVAVKDTGGTPMATDYIFHLTTAP
jgi:Bacterial Ig-like domain